jgi:phosphoribosylaminoimidazole carboxylase (NCAIR synthetase)
MSTIILYGNPIAHWLEALTKHSNLWSNIDGEHRSLITTNNDKIKSIKDKIVIPLQENDILNCPFECLKPDNETIKIFKNKKQFKEFLRTNNINNYPQDYTVDNIEFPVILKRTDLVKGKGVFLINDMEELKLNLSKAIFKNQEYIIEKYIPTDFEPVTWMICKDGEVLWNKSLQWSKENSPIIKLGAETGGIEYNPDEETIALFKKIVKISNYSGPITVNYKMFDGKAIIFEVNPRLGGTLMLNENRHLLIEAINLIINLQGK